jgi:hypothetical protein
MTAMGARIMVETPHVRPVIDGKWHMTWLRNWPVPGAVIETLCGLLEPAEYGSADSAHAVVKMNRPGFDTPLSLCV